VRAAEGLPRRFDAHRSGPSRREQQDAELAGRIREVHEESQGRYGAPRIHAELSRRGRRHGRTRIARRWRKTTIPDPAAAAWAARIRRDFTADAGQLNARWCGDIT
jgi:putative transposase